MALDRLAIALRRRVAHRCGPALARQPEASAVAAQVAHELPVDRVVAQQLARDIPQRVDVRGWEHEARGRFMKRRRCSGSAMRSKLRSTG